MESVITKTTIRWNSSVIVFQDDRHSLKFELNSSQRIPSFVEVTMKFVLQRKEKIVGIRVLFVQTKAIIRQDSVYWCKNEALTTA